MLWGTANASGNCSSVTGGGAARLSSGDEVMLHSRRLAIKQGRWGGVQQPDRGPSPPNTGHQVLPPEQKTSCLPPSISLLQNSCSLEPSRIPSRGTCPTSTNSRRRTQERTPVLNTDVGHPVAPLHILRVSQTKRKNLTAQSLLLAPMALATPAAAHLGSTAGRARS